MDKVNKKRLQSALLKLSIAERSDLYHEAEKAARRSRKKSYTSSDYVYDTIVAPFIVKRKYKKRKSKVNK